MVYERIKYQKHGIEKKHIKGIDEAQERKTDQQKGIPAPIDEFQPQHHQGKINGARSEIEMAHERKTDHAREHIHQRERHRIPARDLSITEITQHRRPRREEFQGHDDIVHPNDVERQNKRKGVERIEKGVKAHRGEIIRAQSQVEIVAADGFQPAHSSEALQKSDALRRRVARLRRPDQMMSPHDKGTIQKEQRDRRAAKERQPHFSPFHGIHFFDSQHTASVFILDRIFAASVACAYALRQARALCLLPLGKGTKRR